MEEFILTLGNLIKACDACLQDVPKSCVDLYAKLFQETAIEKVIFNGESFKEAASVWARKQGWREPQ